MVKGACIKEKPIAEAGDLPGLVAEQEPFIIRGLAADWPLVKAGQKSTAAARAYLLEHALDRHFTYSSAPAGVHGRMSYDDAMQLNFVEQKAPLSEIFAAIDRAESDDTGELIYLSSVETDKYFRALSEAHRLALGSDHLRQSLWMGTRSVVPVHNDFPDNFACVLVGRRRFTLFPPDQLENLYMGPLDFTPAGRSVTLVDIENPDLCRFPKFAHAQECAQTAELAPGDVIHIPSMWWHQIAALDGFNLMMNFWWRREGKHYLGDPESALIHAIMAVRDLPEEKRRVWKRFFDHYIFDHADAHSAHIPEAGRGILAPLTPKTANRIKGYLLRKLNG